MKITTGHVKKIAYKTFPNALLLETNQLKGGKINSAWSHHRVVVGKPTLFNAL